MADIDLKHMMVSYVDYLADAGVTEERATEVLKRYATDSVGTLEQLIRELILISSSNEGEDYDEDELSEIEAPKALRKLFATDLAEIFTGKSSGSYKHLNDDDGADEDEDDIEAAELLATPSVFLHWQNMKLRKAVSDLMSGGIISPEVKEVKRFVDENRHKTAKIAAMYTAILDSVGWDATKLDDLVSEGIISEAARAHCKELIKHGRPQPATEGSSVRVKPGHRKLRRIAKKPSA